MGFSDVIYQTKLYFERPVSWSSSILILTSKASVAQWQSAGLVNQRSWVQSPSEACFYIQYR